MWMLLLLLLLLRRSWRLTLRLMLRLCGSRRNSKSTSNSTRTSCRRRSLPCWPSTVIHYRPQIHDAVGGPCIVSCLLLCYCAKKTIGRRWMNVSRVLGARMRFGIYYRTGGRNRLFAAIAVVVAVAVARFEKRKYCRSSGLCPLSPASLCLAIDLPCSDSPSFGSYLEGSMLQHRYVLCANVDEGDTV